MRRRGTIGWLKHDLTHRGVTAWALFGLLLAFYFFLYFPDKLGELGKLLGLGGQGYAWGKKLDIFQHLMAWLGEALRPALGMNEAKATWTLGGLTLYPKRLGDAIFSKWTLYGALYTLAITAGGVHVMRKYRHNRYQLVRTAVVILVQITFAFTVPMMLSGSGSYGYYFSYLWPLKIDALYPNNLKGMPLPMMLYSVLGAVLLVPLLGVFFGKRWYCSWVCGCGGLANTFGDPWRQLSDKSERAWRFERYSIHSTLALAILTTALVALNALVGARHPELGKVAMMFEFFYGLVVVALLSGAVGVAFYPIGGTRIWCRYFCPMAALLGVVQKFGRYRITVKKDMCISCGMCSTYCEMGIDVRAYAQKNQSFVRASCVGCGLCAEVCPRGVLRLENRYDEDPQELTMNAFLSESYKAEPERKAV